MKPERFATHASAVFMVFVWLIISGLLLLHFTAGIFARTTVAHMFLVVFAWAWFLIPVQVLRYYRKER